MNGFNATTYMAIFGAKNPQIIKQQTFDSPAQNEKFLALMAVARVKLRSGFVPVGELLEKVGLPNKKRFHEVKAG